MKTVWIRMGLVMALTVMASMAVAQGFGRRGGMMGMGGLMPPVMLLNREDVQEDLALTSDQKAKLDEIRDAWREEMRNRFQRGGGGGGGNPDFQAMRAEMEKMQKEINDKVNTVLTPEQQKRIKEISIQMAGNRSVMDKDVATALAMTEAQKKSVQDLMTKLMEANRSIGERMRNQEISREDGMAAMRKNDDALGAEIGKLLTEAQRTKLTELGGKKFNRRDPDGGGFGG